MRKGKTAEDQKYLYQGELRTIVAIARLEAISYYKLARHLRRGETLNDALVLSRRVRAKVKAIPPVKIPRTKAIRIKAIANDARSRTRYITLNGETLSFNQWAARLGLTPGGFRERLATPHRWTFERALTTPNASRKPKGSAQHASL